MDHSPRETTYTITREEPSDCDADHLRTICCFDLVAQNTIRNPELVICAPYGELWGTDHRLTFHSDT